MDQTKKQNKYNLSVFADIKTKFYKYKWPIGILLVFLVFIIIISSTSSTTKSPPNEKSLVNSKIEEYKDKKDKKINYTYFDDVMDKIIYNKLSKAKYSSKSDKAKLIFSQINELLKYEEEIKKNKDKFYQEVYNNSIKMLITSLEWLNPMGKGLGLNPNERIISASVSLAKNIKEEDKIIFSYLYKTDKLKDIIKSLLKPSDYITLMQSKTGITGLFAGSLLL
jgi:hypothetical protein